MPNHAESHYQLAMALVNEGKLAEAATEFNTYLKLVARRPQCADGEGAGRAAAQVVSRS